MDPSVKGTVELTKNEKLKSLNDKLNSLLKNKQLDSTKVTSDAINIKREEKEEKKEKQKEALKEKKEKEKTETQPIPKSKIIKKEEKHDNHTMRKAAGVVWEDKTMEDWPDNDYRIFCGNLGNEVSDDLLGTFFRRYSSFQMARVVRDRRTGKSRGYGFVSLTNPNEFLKALKEMNGVHVGNRPIKVMKSSWKDRELNSQKNQYLPSDFKKNSQKETHKIHMDYRYVNPF